MLKIENSFIAVSVVKGLSVPHPLFEPFGEVIKRRYFIELDPVLNSYHQLVSSISFAGDFIISADVRSVVAGNYAIIADAFSTSIYIRTYPDGHFGLWVAGESFQTDIPIVNVFDGKLHSIIVKRVGTLHTIFMDGVEVGSGTLSLYAGANNFLIGYRNASGTAGFFNGIIASAKFTDLSNTANTQTYKLDRSTGSTEQSSEGNNSLTYVNIPDSNRERYEFDSVSTWNNISASPQELPATIEVA